MKKKVLFKATLREIRFLLDNNYLNGKGIEWANELLVGLNDEVEG